MAPLQWRTGDQATVLQVAARGGQRLTGQPHRGQPGVGQHRHRDVRPRELRGQEPGVKPRGCATRPREPAATRPPCRQAAQRPARGGASAARAAPHDAGGGWRAGSAPHGRGLGGRIDPCQGGEASPKSRRSPPCATSSPLASTACTTRSRRRVGGSSWRHGAASRRKTRSWGRACGGS